jgi:hypothetical protein
MAQGEGQAWLGLDHFPAKAPDFAASSPQGMGWHFS